MLAFCCANAHPAIPALTAGVILNLTRTTDGGLELHLPCTPNVLARLAAAIRDGALVLQSPSRSLEELEVLITGDRNRLLGQAEGLLEALEVRAAG